MLILIALAFVSPSAQAANLAIGLSTVGGDSCAVHGNNVPVAPLGNDLYRLRFDMNTAFSQSWNTNSPSKVGACFLQFTVQPTSGYRAVVADFQQGYSRSLSPASNAKIEIGFVYDQNGSSQALANQYTSANSTGIENSAVNMVKANPIFRGACGLPLTLKLSSVVRVAQRAAAPSAMSASPANLRIIAEPCH